MIYFDHAATTPVDRGIINSMLPFFTDKFGNPSSIYKLGREANQAVIEAREKAANLVGAKNPKEIIFTSGATESNNLAIKGVTFYAMSALKIKPHLIVSAIEHHSMLDTARYLEKNFDCEVTYLPVDKEGRIDPETLKELIRENTVFVSVMYGNNESGTLEPVAKIGALIKKINEGRTRKIIFHTDAVQAFQYFDCSVDRLGVDMLSLTGHKFYGPKGVGLLYVREGVKFLPQQQGGSQEKNRRAGTENVPYIVGFVKAMERAVTKREVGEQKISELDDYLNERILKEIPDVALIGPSDVNKRLPHISTFLFQKVEGEAILINLDLAGIAASSGSACTSGSLEPSHVTKAMGFSDLEAHGAVRFSLGELNSREDVDKLMEILPGIIKKLRTMSPIK